MLEVVMPFFSQPMASKHTCADKQPEKFWVRQVSKKFFSLPMQNKQ